MKGFWLIFAFFLSACDTTPVREPLLVSSGETYTSGRVDQSGQPLPTLPAEYQHCRDFGAFKPAAKATNWGEVDLCQSKHNPNKILYKFKETRNEMICFFPTYKELTFFSSITKPASPICYPQDQGQNEFSIPILFGARPFNSLIIVTAKDGALTAVTNCLNGQNESYCKNVMERDFNSYYRAIVFK